MIDLILLFFSIAISATAFALAFQLFNTVGLFPEMLLNNGHEHFAGLSILAFGSGCDQKLALRFADIDGTRCPTSRREIGALGQPAPRSKVAISTQVEDVALDGQLKRKRQPPVEHHNRGGISWTISGHRCFY